MKKIKKIVFLCALFFIVLWLNMPIIRLILSLEFASDSFYISYKEFLFYAVPIAMLLTLFGTLKSSDRKLIIVGKILGTIAVVFVTILIMIMSMFIDMCGWTDSQVLYKNKNNIDRKIIIREYGCGAYDSDLPNIEVLEVQSFTKYFIRATKIDTTKIDKSEWIKVE
jgi:hypothetical protein